MTCRPNYRANGSTRSQLARSYKLFGELWMVRGVLDIAAGALWKLLHKSREITDFHLNMMTFTVVAITLMLSTVAISLQMTWLFSMYLLLVRASSSEYFQTSTGHISASLWLPFDSSISTQSRQIS